MSSPYRDFLGTKEDGRVWWWLPEATKLVAGFRPASNIHGPFLISPNPRATSLDCTLTAAVRKQQGIVDPPNLVRVGDKEFVVAMEFLDWYAGFLLETGSDQSLPAKLAQAVSDAEADARGSPRYLSLVGMLGPFWKQPLSCLPFPLAEKVRGVLGLSLWDSLSPDQRQVAAHQWDVQHDPAHSGEMSYYWNLVVRKIELREEILRWERVATPTALDIEVKERRLEDLKRRLENLQMKPPSKSSKAYLASTPNEGQEEGDDTDADHEAKPIPYLQAIDLLSRKLNARPAELAGWVFLGQKDGGLQAYLSGNEFGYRAKFAYQAIDGEDFDYMGPLMATWYRPSDIESFEPKERFLTSAELMTRWASVPGIATDAFIRAKIAESRLMDLNPLAGGTKWSEPGNQLRANQEDALFCLSHVTQIEAEDFPKAAPEAHKRPRTGSRNARLQHAAEDLVKKLRMKDKYLEITKREVAAKLASTDAWKDHPASTIERIISRTW
jgi:hypothetical protein